MHKNNNKLYGITNGRPCSGTVITGLGKGGGLHHHLRCHISGDGNVSSGGSPTIVIVVVEPVFGKKDDT